MIAAERARLWVIFPLLWIKSREKKRIQVEFITLLKIDFRVSFFVTDTDETLCKYCIIDFPVCLFSKVDTFCYHWFQSSSQLSSFI